MRPTAILQFRRAVLEVERKFRCDPKITQLIRKNTGNPSFTSLDHLGQQQFEDIYFDKDDTLSRHGIWVRQRNGNWQAKVRQKKRAGSASSGQAGMYANSQFEELSTRSDILKAIRGFFNNTKDVDAASDTFGLQQMARFTTFREMWKVNGIFEVVLDTTDYGHSVGEVELQETIEVDDDDGMSAAQKQQRTSEMDGQSKLS